MLEPNMESGNYYFCQYFSDGLFMLGENGLLIVMEKMLEF